MPDLNGRYCPVGGAFVPEWPFAELFDRYHAGGFAASLIFSDRYMGALVAALGAGRLDGCFDGCEIKVAD